MDLVKLCAKEITVVKNYTYISDNEFKALKTSIHKYGQIQPIGVVKHEENYVCIYGTKILKAIQELNIELCFCIIHDISLEESMKLYLQTQVYEKKFDYISISEELRKLNLTFAQITYISSLDLEEVKDLIELTNYDWSDLFKKKITLEIDLPDEENDQLDLFNNQ